MSLVYSLNPTDEASLSLSPLSPFSLQYSFNIFSSLVIVSPHNINRTPVISSQHNQIVMACITSHCQRPMYLLSPCYLSVTPLFFLFRPSVSPSYKANMHIHTDILTSISYARRGMKLYLAVIVFPPLLFPSLIARHIINQACRHPSVQAHRHCRRLPHMV